MIRSSGVWEYAVVLSSYGSRRITKGEKIVVQLMLDLVDDDISNNATESWLDYIIDT